MIYIDECHGQKYLYCIAECILVHSYDHPLGHACVGALVEHHLRYLVLWMSDIIMNLLIFGTMYSLCKRYLV